MTADIGHMALPAPKRAMSSIAMLVVEIAAVIFISIVVYSMMQTTDEIKTPSEAAYTGAFDMARTGLRVSDITALSIDNNLTDAEAVIITISAIPGSEPINLDNTLVYIQIGNRTARLNIRNGTTVKDLEEGFYTK